VRKAITVSENQIEVIDKSIKKILSDAERTGKMPSLEEIAELLQKEIESLVTENVQLIAHNLKILR